MPVYADGVINAVRTPSWWGRPLLCAGAGLLLVVVSMGRWGSSDATARSLPETVVPMVAAARDLPGGAVLGAADMRVVGVRAADLPPSAVGDPSRLAGRRLAVGARQGDPVLAAMTVDAGSLPAGRRTVTVRLAADDLPAEAAPGMQVEVVAAIEPQSAASGRAEERVIALARVAGVGREAGSATPASPPPPGGSATASSAGAVVVLDCGAADALRILWARDFARTMRLVGHPASEPAAPAATGAPA